jgi:hypothetical protein
MVAKGRGSLVRQHAESRFLIFKDADDVARLPAQVRRGRYLRDDDGAHQRDEPRHRGDDQVLGPNPNATLQWMKQNVDEGSAAAANGEAARFPRRSELLGYGSCNPEDYASKHDPRLGRPDVGALHRQRGEHVPSSDRVGRPHGHRAQRDHRRVAAGRVTVGLGTDPIMQKIARMYAGVAYDRSATRPSGFDLDRRG